MAESLKIVERCRFSLQELACHYPREAGEEEEPQARLERLAREGARKRYPQGVPEKVQRSLKHELEMIGAMNYAPYFLTVHDIVRFAEERGILCQGRGSAANSTVCYCLGITAVDPALHELLFERFVSPERDEPPDIDVDFEHERREEVIQHIYEKYGRERTGLTAIVVCYRTRGALRDVGKALGISQDVITALAGSVWGWGSEKLKEESVRALGLDPTEPRLALALRLAEELIGFPAPVAARGRLRDHPGPARRGGADRECRHGRPHRHRVGQGRHRRPEHPEGGCAGARHAHLPAQGLRADPPAPRPQLWPARGATGGSASLCHAVARRLLGVFQVESRAQMAMLPRLKPKTFYDLVIEVAIVRPGPIQGDMVHPYLRRRMGLEEPSYPSPELRQVLERTLGVPLFQEQAMQIAIVAAGFSPAEADRLRRAMATFKRNGDIENFRERFIEGMVARSYERDFAERCFKQIEGFSTYGFPESHAASFALLVYVSAWMKCHYPEAFACALLNSQPMGFYAPAQIVRDAREHGVEVLPVDVNRSDWDCTLEPKGARPALRLGLRQVKGLGEEAARQLVERRGNGYADPLALWRRAGLSGRSLEALARADAFRSMGLDRRAALWAVKGLPEAEPLPLFAAAGEEDVGEEPKVELPALPPEAQVMEDYSSLRLSLKAHPVSFLRDTLARQGFRPCGQLLQARNGERLAVAGLVLVRQRPGSANGVIFLTLEDETGIANLVVWPRLFERQRPTLLGASLLGVRGKVQREGEVIHLVSEDTRDLSPWLYRLQEAGSLPPAENTSQTPPHFRGRNFH